MRIEVDKIEIATRTARDAAVHRAVAQLPDTLRGKEREVSLVADLAVSLAFEQIMAMLQIELAMIRAYHKMRDADVALLPRIYPAELLK